MRVVYLSVCDGAVIRRDGPIDHSPPFELACLDATSGGHSAPQIGIVQHPPQCVGERQPVVRRDQQRSLAAHFG